MSSPKTSPRRTLRGRRVGRIEPQSTRRAQSLKPGGEPAHGRAQDGNQRRGHRDAAVFHHSEFIIQNFSPSSLRDLCALCGSTSFQRSASNALPAAPCHARPQGFSVSSRSILIRYNPPACGDASCLKRQLSFRSCCACVLAGCGLEGTGTVGTLSGGRHWLQSATVTR